MQRRARTILYSPIPSEKYVTVCEQRVSIRKIRYPSLVGEAGDNGVLGTRNENKGSRKISDGNAETSKLEVDSDGLILMVVLKGITSTVDNVKIAVSGLDGAVPVLGSLSGSGRPT